MTAPLQPSSRRLAHGLTAAQWREELRAATAAGDTEAAANARQVLQEHVASLGRRAQRANREDREAARPGALSSLGIGFSQGATFGLGDEAAGLVEGILRAPRAGTFGEGYRSGRDASRQTYNEAQGFARGVGDLAGSLASGAGTAGLVAKAGKGGAALARTLRAGGSPGSSFGQRAAAAATGGALAGGEGAVHGLGRGESVDDRVNQALMGMLVGGALGTAGTGVANTFARRAGRQATKAATEEAQAASARTAAQRNVLRLEDDIATGPARRQAAELTPAQKQAAIERQRQLIASGQEATERQGELQPLRLRAADDLHNTRSRAAEEAAMTRAPRITALEDRAMSARLARRAAEEGAEDEATILAERAAQAPMRTELLRRALAEADEAAEAAGSDAASVFIRNLTDKGYPRDVAERLWAGKQAGLARPAGGVAVVERPSPPLPPREVIERTARGPRPQTVEPPVASIPEEDVPGLLRSPAKAKGKSRRVAVAQVSPGTSPNPPRSSMTGERAWRDAAMVLGAPRRDALRAMLAETPTEESASALQAMLQSMTPAQRRTVEGLLPARWRP